MSIDFFNKFSAIHRGTLKVAMGVTMNLYSYFTPAVGFADRKALKNEGQSQSVIALIADGVGFEPTEGFPSAVFKTAAFNHSATHPYSARRGGIVTQHLPQGKTFSDNSSLAAGSARCRLRRPLPLTRERLSPYGACTPGGLPGVDTVPGNPPPSPHEAASLNNIAR